MCESWKSAKQKVLAIAKISIWRRQDSYSRMFQLFINLAPRRWSFSAAKMAIALTRRFQNLPKIEGVGFLSVSRRESLLGEREVHSEPPFKYCSQPSVEYTRMHSKSQSYTVFISFG